MKITYAQWKKIGETNNWIKKSNIETPLTPEAIAEQMGENVSAQEIQGILNAANINLEEINPEVLAKGGNKRVMQIVQDAVNKLGLDKNKQWVLRGGTEAAEHRFYSSLNDLLSKDAKASYFIPIVQSFPFEKSYSDHQEATKAKAQFDVHLDLAEKILPLDNLLKKTLGKFTAFPNLGDMAAALDNRLENSNHMSALEEINESYRHNPLLFNQYVESSNILQGAKNVGLAKRGDKFYCIAYDLDGLEDFLEPEPGEEAAEDLKQFRNLVSNAQPYGFSHEVIKDTVLASKLS